MTVDNASENSLRLRLHWASIVTAPLILLVLATIVFTLVTTHTGWIARWLHIYQGQPLAAVLLWMQEHGKVVVIYGAIATAMVFLVRFLSWSVTFVEISPVVVTYRQSPWAINQIATHTIQGIREYQGLWGAMLDYGTLIIDSGNDREVLPFVPRFQDVKTALTPRS
jgi:hypothetical protein